MLREKIIRIIGACTVAAVMVSGCGGNGSSNTSNTSEKSKYSTEVEVKSAAEEPSETKILSMNSRHSNMVSTDEGM